MTDHITEKKVESEGKVFNKNRGKTVSKSKVFSRVKDIGEVVLWLDEVIESGESLELKSKYTVTVTKHLD